MMSSSESFPDIPQEKLDDVFTVDDENEEVPAGVRHDQNYGRFSPPEEDYDDDIDPYEDMIVYPEEPRPELTDAERAARGPGPEGARKIREYNRFKHELDKNFSTEYNQGAKDTLDFMLKGIDEFVDKGILTKEQSDVIKDALFTKDISGILPQLEQHRLSQPEQSQSRSRRISLLAQQSVRRKF